MAIKRYTTEELQQLCKDIFYDCILSNSGYEVSVKNLRLNKYTDKIYNMYMSLIAENEERRRMYINEIYTNNDKTISNILKKEEELLEEEYKIYKTMNMQSQKQRYISTGKIDYTRTMIRIPLNKKINSFYDDFSLDVLFYDDVFTPSGKYDYYSKIEDSEDKLNFLKENTEITHMGLLLFKSESMSRALTVINLMGTLNEREPRVLENKVQLLPQKFSDFKNLHLADLNVIKNNDLKQIIQSKIDLDQENMELLATASIRGNDYKLFKYTLPYDETEQLYIRYVCDSTGRVYYNLLNVSNLRLSKYFNENKMASYLHSWWNITHLGASIQGKPVISC